MNITLQKATVLFFASRLIFLSLRTTNINHLNLPAFGVWAALISDLGISLDILTGEISICQTSTDCSKTGDYQTTQALVMVVRNGRLVSLLQQHQHRLNLNRNHITI